MTGIRVTRAFGSRPATVPRPIPVGPGTPGRPVQVGAKTVIETNRFATVIPSGWKRCVFRRFCMFLLYLGISTEVFVHVEVSNDLGSELNVIYAHPAGEISQTRRTVGRKECIQTTMRAARGGRQEGTGARLGCGRLGRKRS